MSHKCEARNCKNPMGPEHFSEDEDNEYSIEHCVYCGIKCMHRNCMSFDNFTCIECTYVILNKKTIRYAGDGIRITSTNRYRFDYSMNEHSSSSSSFLSTSTTSAYTCSSIEDTNNNNNNDIVTNNSENVKDKMHPVDPKKSNRLKKLIQKIDHDFEEAKFSICIERCDFTKIAEIANDKRGTKRRSASGDIEKNSSKKRRVTG